VETARSPFRIGIPCALLVRRRSLVHSPEEDFAVKAPQKAGLDAT
jgi:hypothetical protein